MALALSTKVANFVHAYETSTNVYKNYYLFFFLSITLFYITKVVILSGLKSEEGRLLAYLFSFFLVYQNWSLSQREFPQSFKIVLSTLVALFGLYLLLAVPSISKGDLSTYHSLELFEFRYVAIIGSILFFVKPAFGILPFTYTIIYKSLLVSVFGFPISSTDYAPLVEAGIFLFICTAIYKKLFEKYSFLESKDVDIKYLEFAILLSVFVHLSNYFYSGLKKIWMSDFSLWFWSVNNKTQYLILNTWELKLLPISFSDSVTSNVFLFFEHTYIASNFFVLFIQCATIICVLGTRSIRIFTFLFDCMHLAIFAVTGILFYKWMIYNLLIIIAVSKLEIKTIPTQMKFLFGFLLIIAPTVFFVSKFGWFDTRALNNEYFVAVTNDGKRLRVPTNYFLQHSVTFAQQRAIKTKSEPFFPIGTNGSTSGMSNMFDANQCNFTKQDKLINIEDHISRDQSRKIKKQINLLHNFYLDIEQRTSRPYNYDFYPHHVFSMPWWFKEFKSIRKENIKYYEYRIDSQCQSLENNALKKDVYVSGVMKIDIGNGEN